MYGGKIFKMGIRLFVPVDKDDLPKVGTSVDIGGIVYSIDEKKSVIEEIAEGDNRKINFYILSVQREVSRGLFTRKIRSGLLRYDNIEKGTYLPGDEGWQERHDFLQSRRKIKK